MKDMVMEAFPFSEDEWDAVQAASLPIVSATFEKDWVLRNSSFVNLVAVLDDLRETHGEHPSLLETEADFTDQNSRRIQLYERAASLAEANQIQTVTIRISLAEALLEVGRTEEAKQTLLACEHEERDEWEAKEWARLMAECERRIAIAP